MLPYAIITPTGAVIDGDPGNNSATAALQIYDPPPLTVSLTGPGTGDVVDLDNFDGIDCPSVACSVNYPYGKVVTLTAYPAGQWTFAGWSEACTNTVGVCVTTITQSTALTAEFSLEYDLEVLVEGVAGSGVITSTPSTAVDPPTGIDCAAGQFCFQNFIFNTPVTVTASPVITSSFEGWQGHCSNLSGDCNLVMNENKSLVGTFKYRTVTTLTSHLPISSVVGQPVSVNYTMTPLVSGAPEGTTTVALPGDPATCAGPVPTGSCVLTPTLAATRQLTATYSGDFDYGRSWDRVTHIVNKADTTINIIADEPDPSVTGEVVVVSYTISVNAPGSGTPTGSVQVINDGGYSCVGTVAAGNCHLTPLGAAALPSMRP